MYTGIQRKQAYKKGELRSQEKTPTMQNHAYRIITKNLQSWSPKKNLKMNKGPNIQKIPIHTPKPPTISLTP